MPVLSPAGVQEILDYGLYGWALSRFAGLWVGLKLMKDTVEATAVVDGRPDRMTFVTPDFDDARGRAEHPAGRHRVPQEARLHRPQDASPREAFARANGIDQRVWGKPGAKIGFVAAGKNWLDLVHALELLGIDEAEAERLGITTYKIGQVWPLDMKGFHDWAEGLDLIVVVEEKRKLIEVQIKERSSTTGRRCGCIGAARRATGAELFPTHWRARPGDDRARSSADILRPRGAAPTRIRGRR